MTQSQVGETMSGMVLSGRGERQQSTARAGNRDERGIEYRHAKNQDGNQPGGGEMRSLRTNLQSERGHQKTQKHGAAIAHEDLGGIEIPAQEPQRGPQNGGGESADHGLPVETGDED